MWAPCVVSSYGQFTLRVYMGSLYGKSLWIGYRKFIWKVFMDRVHGQLVRTAYMERLYGQFICTVNMDSCKGKGQPCSRESGSSHQG